MIDREYVYFNLKTILELSVEDKELIKRSEEWYPIANSIAVKLADKFDLSVVKTCAIISVLSPGCKWKQNIKDTHSLLSALKHEREIPKCNTYNAQVEKAVKLYYVNSNSFEVMDSIVGRGLKTLNFYRAIFRPIGDAIVIDRWMIRACGLNKNSVRENEYYEIADIIKKLATEYGQNPQALQARLWLIAKEYNDNQSKLI